MKHAHHFSSCLFGGMIVGVTLAPFAIQALGWTLVHLFAGIDVVMDAVFG